MRVFPYKITGNDQSDFMKEIGVSPAGISIMKPRFSLFSFVVQDISSAGANALKQHLLHVGGEVAVPRETISQTEEKVTALCTLPVDAIPKIIERFKQQWWHLPEIAEFLSQQLHAEPPWFDFQTPHIDTTRPAIMGILNLTPDSFSDGGKYLSVDHALQIAEQMIDAGVDILDIGGESSRPGADFVTEKEELERTIPLIQKLHNRFPKMPISIDTTKSVVAQKALQAGATIVNDISGLQKDSAIADVVAKEGATLIVMHMKGEPKTMQNTPQYDNLLFSISASLEKSVKKAVNAGINKNKIIIDPGIGFGKTVEHNLSIIKHLEWLTSFQLPIMVGASRKSVIGAVTGTKNPNDRLAGTVALHTLALQNGAAILRVHDVSEAIQSRQIFSAVRGAPCC